MQNCPAQLQFQHKANLPFIPFINYIGHIHKNVDRFVDMASKLNKNVNKKLENIT